SSSSGYFLGLDMTADDLLSPGQHPGAEVPAKPGPAQLLMDGTTSYVYAPDGTPLEQITSGGSANYFLHDQIGSTRLLTSSTGTVIATYTYDAYGNLASQTGTATNPLKYVGAYNDGESGALYLINRYYDPAAAV